MVLVAKTVIELCVFRTVLHGEGARSCTEGVAADILPTDA